MLKETNNSKNARAVATFIGDVCGIVNDLLAQNLLIHFITLQDHYSDTLVIEDDITESDKYMKPKGKAQFFAPKSGGLSKVKNLLSISLT